MKKNAHELLTHIAQAILDKKGFNILVLNVEGISTLTDYFIIAEGTVDRHVKAIANDVVDVMEKHGRHPYHVEGQQEGDWVVLDFVDVVIHLFQQGLREKYTLEEVWRAGRIVDVTLDLPQNLHQNESRQEFEE